MDPLIQWGLPIVQWIQTFRTPLLDVFFRGASFLGEADFYILLLPLLIWCLHKQIGYRLAVLYLLSAYVNLTLKSIFATPRPYQVDPTLYAPLQTPGYGIPSGHTQSAVVTWGLFATHFRTRFWWALAVVLSIVIGLSRMYLGDHFPQDVIAGALVGALLLAIYIAVEPHVEKWFVTRTPLRFRLALAIIVPLVLAGVYLKDSAVALGTFWGAWIGLTLEGEWVRFDYRASLVKQVLKLALGIAIALGIRFGLKAVFPEGDVSDFIRYGVIGFWVTFGAPWLFVRTRLAEQFARPSPVAGQSSTVVPDR